MKRKAMRAAVINMFQTILNSYDVFFDFQKADKDFLTKAGEYNNVKFDYMEIDNHKCLKNIYSTNPYDYLAFLSRK